MSRCPLTKLPLVSSLLSLFSVSAVPVWLREYQLANLPSDVIAGLVVGILVIPQSLGYAALAGLPPEYGLYAAIVPVLVYAWAGASMVQAVGPVAIAAIMTASSLAPYADRGVAVYVSMASLQAVLVGVMLCLAGWLKLGWITQFISRGVASGFISGAAVLIFISQLKYVTGVPFSGNTLLSYLHGFIGHIHQLHGLTTLLGAVGFVLLLLNRHAKGWLWGFWLNQADAKWAERLFPLGLVVVFIGLSHLFGWGNQGVKVIGIIPSGLPHWSLPAMPKVDELMTLLPNVGLMALIIFVSSHSVASHYARLRRERFDASLELKGLGLANLVGGFFQSFAIAGGVSRTAINVDSGAKSPIASVVTVGVMVSALLVLGPLMSPLPYALLGATIMSSVIGLIDWRTFIHAWRVDRLDAISFSVTFVAVLVFGLNMGLVLGLLASFASLIWQSSQPHIAIVGVLEGTEHFRNINRHDVQTFDNLLIMRIDESLFFGNSESVQMQLFSAIKTKPQASEIIIIMSAVNHIDLTAQEMLIELNHALVSQNKRLHYAVIKGPVMDVIEHTDVIKQLSGKVYLSTIKAVQELKK